MDDSGIAKYEQLPREKRERIRDICIGEFTQYGYEHASTNRMTRRMGISKGSLFYYFGSKENLYLYFLGLAAASFIKEMRKSAEGLPGELLARFRGVVASALEFYESHPGDFRFFMSFADIQNSEIQGKFLSRVGGAESLKVLASMFEGVQTENLRFSREHTVQVLKWVFAGIKHEIFARPVSDIGVLKKELMEKIDIALSIFESGIYNKEES